MSDLWEAAVNLYRLRLVPTVKRMLDRRRISYTLLTVGVLTVSAAALALLIAYATESLVGLNTLAEEYDLYLMKYLSGGNKRSPMPEMRETIALAKAGAVAFSVFCGGLWLILSAVGVGWVMSAVMESEAYVYGLFMIYGADRKQLSRQLSLEFLVAGIPAVCLGTPLGIAAYRLIGGSGSLSLGRLCLAVLSFLILISVSASILARRMLKRSCMGLLNASDTADLTTSPRRSHLGGLKRKRGLLSSALLAFSRMRRHYVALALVAAIVSATAFGSLSLSGSVEQTASAPAHTLYFSQGITSEEMKYGYLENLDWHAAVRDLSYAVTDTAEELGIHLKLTEEQNPALGGVYLGAQYATDGIRIACGDGDTYYELGGSNPIPPEFSHISPSNMTRLGYDLEAVPDGYAVYVYPEQTGPTLRLRVGDTVTLSIPREDHKDLSDAVEEEGETVTVRIADIVSVGSVRVLEGGPEVCPRITEDYLYISPSDYEKFSRDERAESFTAEEVYPDQLFGDRTENTCILAVPEGYFGGGEIPDTVTVIHPADTVKSLFSMGKTELEHEEYFINQTYRGTGVYLGTEEAYLTDPNASPLLEEHAKDALAAYMGGSDLTLLRREYEITTIIPMPAGSKPFLILPHTDEINYNRLYNDLCALRLEPLSDDAPALTTIHHEAYVLSTSIPFGRTDYGRHLYLGTSLMGDFITAMDKAGISLQIPVPTFSHSRVTARGSFSIGNTHYLLAEPFSDFNTQYPELEADHYPRYVTGVGSFRTVGDTSKNTVLSAKEESFYATFHEDSIGALKEESLPIKSHYAVGDWVIAPASETAIGEKPAKGYGVISVPNPEKSPIHVGDTLSVAIRQDTSAFMNDPELMGLTGDRLLAYLQERIIYEYATVVVSDIVQGERNTLILAEEDMQAILGQNGVYTRLNVYLYPTVTLQNYLDFHIAVTSLTKAASHEVTLLYDESFITHAVSGPSPSVLLICMGGAALCLLPLLLTASRFLFYGKREEEYAILYAIGKTARERKRAYWAEAALFCITVTTAAALACPIGYGFLLMAADTLELPLPTASFDPALYGGVVGLAAVASVLVSVLTFRRMKKHVFQHRTD